MQGCGSVLATQNLDTISFEYSTQQRSSTSQHFTKPRLIARPTQLNLHGNGEDQSQHATDDACREKAREQHIQREERKAGAKGAAGQQKLLQGVEGSGRLNGSLQDQAAAHGITASRHDDGSTAEGGRLGPQIYRLQDQTPGRNQMDPGGFEDVGGTSDQPPAHNGSATMSSCLAVADCQTGGDVCSEEAALIHWLQHLQLRYFAPREVANLHSFPSSFSFPLHVTKKQQYALLGNSLSVAVVADLLSYLLGHH